MAEAMGVTVKMEEDRDLVDPSRDPADFVKDFQEYLTQQTNQVNLISGSVASEREPEALKGGELLPSVIHFKPKMSGNCSPMTQAVFFRGFWRDYCGERKVTFGDGSPIKAPHVPSA